MRTTLACQWCRAAKVKCHHHGSAPCQACTFHPGRECVLSTPKHVSKRTQTFKCGKSSSSRVSRNPRISELQPTTVPAPSISFQHQPDQPNATPILSQPNLGESGKSSSQPTEAPDNRNPAAGVSQSLLEEAFNAFVRHFPEFNFFHQPSFLEALDKQTVSVLLRCAILALTARFVPEICTPYGSSAKAGRCFANYVRRNIMDYTAAAMDLDSCQALVMLCLYDWGEGDGSRAWIYNGMAARIAHGVHARSKGLAEHSPSSWHNSQLEEARRTVWACFLVDAMIGCGKCHASNHSMSVRGVPLPLGEDDFAFARNPISDESFLDVCDPELDSFRYPSPSALGHIGCDRSLALIIQGFGVWHTISAWVAAGGRKRDSLASKTPPWQGSSFFARSMAALKHWRASQHPQLHYSPSNMNLRVYITRGQGEGFAMINLVYYLSVIFLYREYLPFAPHIIDRPPDSINSAPSLEGSRVRWRDQSYQDMYAASSSIIMIMQQLDQRGIRFQTPFTCFCVFSAATWLLCMTPSMVQDMDAQQHSSLLPWTFEWLGRACKVWGVACGWYHTLLTLNQLWSQTGPGTINQTCSQGESLPTLEENVQRLAGVETPQPGDTRTTNILLLLQRQQRRRQSTGGPCAPIAINEATQPPQGSEGFPPISSDDLGSDIGAEIPLPSSPFRLDQDMFTTILTDSAGSWFRSFVDQGSPIDE